MTSNCMHPGVVDTQVDHSSSTLSLVNFSHGFHKTGIVAKNDV